MTSPKRSKLHVVMFPWLAYGHIIPFVHLSNKLAQRGHRVSFLLPKSAQLKLQSLIQNPTLIQFYTLNIPRLDGLPPNAETTSEVPLELYDILFHAFDQTQGQVQSYLSSLKPDVVFYDLAFWVAALGRDKPDGFKSVVYQVVNSVMLAYSLVPSRMLLTNKMDDAAAIEELKHPPPGFPSTHIQVSHYDVFKALVLVFKPRSSGSLTFFERTSRVVQESDAVALMTCNEIEGRFCDYLRQEYGKPVLLTGPILPEASATQLEEKWTDWLAKFDVGTVVYCGFGSQIILEKNQFQELVLGFELTGLPFLVALPPPNGCATIEEALPEGFQERVRGRGWVYGGWVPQLQILSHPNVGCFVGHCGIGCMWEALLSDCQIVLVPQMMDHFMGAKLMVDELKVAVEVDRGDNLWLAEESLSQAIKMVMDRDSEKANELKKNHAKLRETISSQNYQDGYIENFIQSLQGLLDSN